LLLLLPLPLPLPSPSLSLLFSLPRNKQAKYPNECIEYLDNPMMDEACHENMKTVMMRDATPTVPAVHIVPTELSAFS